MAERNAVHGNDFPQFDFTLGLSKYFMSVEPLIAKEIDERL